ncbi:hypothetical protein JZ751_022633 [Albula glossodonta]|uniref:Ig-like domain-containing protein n=1 Tax=Albula glossodonta TaxID=121402 RepID=A0A8T2PFV1_9TELE|nr:hypothetical protein JZ751_022633 [Albula glossodonta]
MGPLSPSRPAQALTHLLLTVLAAGGLVSLSLVCDGATVVSHITPVNVTPDSMTAGPVTEGPMILLSIPDTNGTDVPPAVSGEEEKDGSVVEQHPPKEKAVEGEDVTFSCLLKGGDPHRVVVEWVLKGPESEHTVIRGNNSLNDRAFLSGDLHGGDFSMMLRNVSVADSGDYVCILYASDGQKLQGSGTKLSIRKDQGLQALEESVGTIIGVTVAAVGVAIGLVALLFTQFREKLNCLQK